MRKKYILLASVLLSFVTLTSCQIVSHNHTIVVDSAIPATCTVHGLTEGSHCETCGEIIVPQEVIEPLGHDVVLDQATSATCTEDGITAGAHCSRCNEVIIAQDIIKHNGHKIAIDQAVPATCTVHGLTEGSHCETCGEIIVPQEILEPLGHDVVLDQATSATCTEDGITAGAHCSRCNEVIVPQEIIKHTGHTIVADDAIPATCTVHGLTEGSHCETCGEIIVPQEIVEPLGHSILIDEPVEPTCSEEGKTFGIHCSRCDSTIIEQECVSKKPHTKGTFIKPVTTYVQNVRNPGLFECSVCNQQYYDTIENDDIGMPVISLDGDFSNISKDNKKEIMISYSDENQSFESYATIKWQGNTSIAFPKKNYNIQFFKDSSYKSKQKIQLVESWGKQSKYTLKANWVDFSQLRNVVAAKLYGDVVHSRNIEDEYSHLFNGGAIDGYPILVFQNGVYQGLYTLNTAKDEYIFGMKGDDSTREAILMAEDWGHSCELIEPIPEDFGESWEVEYASTEDNKEIGISWVRESFNNMIDFINNNNGESFVNGIDNYINVPRTIDAFLLISAIKSGDSSRKNILWTTYDGTHWTSSVYDMDGSFGLDPFGGLTVDTSAWPATMNLLWKKIYEYLHDDVVARWQELREGPLSITNIDDKVINLYKLIPGYLYDCERERWGAVPNQYENHPTQMINWAIEALHNMDEYLGANIDENYGYSVSFVTDDAVKIKAYISNDYNNDSHETKIAYSRNSDTGLLTNSDGQINFKVTIPEGYEIDNITITGNYKNLKGPSDTGIDNMYRVTKISSNLTINISIKLK